RREANPLATMGSVHYGARQQSFNRRREANPLATRAQAAYQDFSTVFQSQTRSQTSGDRLQKQLIAKKDRVSIADAKPILWRHEGTPWAGSISTGFQSQTRSQSSGDCC